MNKLLYGIIPAAAFVIIFVNAFFGHLIFVSDAEQVSNKYSVYAHLQPEWNSDSKNIIFDVTNSWYKTDSDNDGSSNHTLNAESKAYNANQLQYINEKSYVELKHEFSDCQEEWQPMLYRKAVDSVRHEIEYIQGKQLSSDSDIVIYPDIDNPNYDNVQQQSKIKNGYAQFIPICTSKSLTSYDYSIKMDNTDLGFDVYFVPSSVQQSNLSGMDFDHYGEPGCFGQNKQSFSGTCSNVEKNSGLLVILPDELDPWITKITVNLNERE